MAVEYDASACHAFARSRPWRSGLLCMIGAIEFRVSSEDRDDLASQDLYPSR